MVESRYVAVGRAVVSHSQSPFSGLWLNMMACGHMQITREKIEIGTNLACYLCPHEQPRLIAQQVARA